VTEDNARDMSRLLDQRTGFDAPQQLLSNQSSEKLNVFGANESQVRDSPRFFFATTQQP